jgi:hypothetical protein
MHLQLYGDYKEIPLLWSVLSSAGWDAGVRIIYTVINVLFPGMARLAYAIAVFFD